MSGISERKKDHINLALQPQNQSGDGSGLDDYQFEPSPLPELALEDVDSSSLFLNRSIAAPLMIGAMTGGCDNAEIINRHLCEAAEHCQIPMALGSQRAALELGLPQSARQWIPNGILLGNLGATQLKQQGVDLAIRAVESVDADALVIHLNPLQELIQPEGDRDWNHILEVIQHCAETLPVPLIVKEVGCGIGPRGAQQLADAGIAWIEVAGRGGTNWAAIEIARNSCQTRQQIAEPFVNWGFNTAQALVAVAGNCPSMQLIGSGGVRNGLDIARCIRLGAQITAIAQPFLQPATVSTQAVVDQIEIFQEQLRWTLFLTGSANLQQLKLANILTAKHTLDPL